MKNRYVKYFMLFVFCLLVFPLVSKAECSYERKAELGRLAGNVQLSYSYVIKDRYPVFTVDISNLTNDIYAVDEFGNVFGGARTSGQYAYETSVTYTIYSNDINCKDEKILNKHIALPRFNMYSLYDECKEYKDAPFCQLWGNIIDSDNAFYRAIDAYNAALNKKKNKNVSNESKIIKFLNKVFTNKIVIAAILLGLVILVIFVTRRNKNEKKNS
ncbi:MAG: hypothetical protein IKG27_04685 [Bacilli bacterium]|nr:hypothetical protein [Bacilli bacterium]